MRQRHIRSDCDRLMNNELSQLVLPRLKQFDCVLLSRECRSHGRPRQAMKLVNKFHRVLVVPPDRAWRGRAHFFAIAGRAMRLRLSDKGCRTPVPYVPVEKLESPPVDLELAIDIDLDRLLDELTAIHPGWCTVVEMKCFLGLTDQEAAEVLGMRLHTLQHMWRNARGWLRERMEANATT